MHSLSDSERNPAAAAPLLSIQGISKRFGSTVALQEVSLQVHAGEVLALIGENGAGKSTLLKTLSGAHRADTGEMSLAGIPYHPRGPHDARHSGVAMIYQELNLASDLSVEDNVLLGQRGTGSGLLFRSRQRGRVRDALARVGLADLNPLATVASQSVATQQLVEIARALASDARIILFDEPTSSLPQRDVLRLFKIVASLKHFGIGVVYISHFLEEVREVADSYVVLRDGSNVGAGQIENVSDNQIVSLMVGRDVDDLFPHVPHDRGELRVEVNSLSGLTIPRNVSMQLHRGEILGVAGLVGAGRTELLRCLFGIDPVTAGSTKVDGRLVASAVKPRMKAGFGMLSEDRKNEGLAQDLSIVENITLGNLGRYTSCGIINLQQRRDAVDKLLEKMFIKARSCGQPVSELSGGNQQKVAIARILHQQADILLMDEPTKGIDVGTKAEIYRMMGELARQGRSVVFVSSYLPELLAVCDSIAVMTRGQLREVRPAAEWTEEEILAAAIDLDESRPTDEC